MSGRPKPQIILSIPLIENTDIELAIALAKNYYIILYDTKPINIIRTDRGQDKWKDIKRYLKSGYPNIAHAQRQADKFNELFKTDKFTVRKIL